MQDIDIAFVFFGGFTLGVCLLALWKYVDKDYKN